MNPAPKRQPNIPWSRRAAFAGVAVFAALAAWPYLSATTRVIAAGEKPTAEKVAKTANDERLKEEKEKHAKEHAKEIKAVAALGDGRIFLGNRGGLAVLENGAVKAVDGWPGSEVKSLAAAGATLYAVSKETVWQLDGGAWKKSYEGDAHSVAVGPDQAVYLGTKMGLKRSKDGAKWEDVDAQMPAGFAAKIEHEKKEKEMKEKKDHEGKPGEKKEK